MKKIVVNATIITVNKENKIYNNGYLEILDNKIVAIGDMHNFTNLQDCQIIDAHNCILMPTMVNAHTHLSMIPFRGLEDDCFDRLRKFLLPMEKEWMDKELACLAAYYGIAESLLAGVGCLVDMYYFEDNILNIAKEMGIRGYFGETLMDNKTPSFSSSDFYLTKFAKEFNKCFEDNKVFSCLAPHSTMLTKKETLVKAKKIAKQYNLLYTLHCAEMDYESTYFKEKYNLTPIGYLANLNVLDEKTLLAHCINVSKEDLALLSSKKVNVVHCLGSNTKAAKGIAPIKEMVQHNINVCLGTDGPSSGNTLDIFTQLKLFADIHKNKEKNRAAWRCQDIIRLATINGAKALGLEQICGSLEVGKRADFMIIECDSINMFPIYDPCSAIVYSANASNVKDVFIDGKQLVKGKELVYFDKKKIKAALLTKMNKTAFKPLF